MEIGAGEGGCVKGVSKRWRVEAALVFPGWYVVDGSKRRTGDDPALMVAHPEMLYHACRRAHGRLDAEAIERARGWVETMCVAEGAM